MTKESLIEKFWKDCKDKKLEPMSECEQIDMMWDFFWNEMQKEREGLVRELIKIKDKYSKGEWTTDEEGEEVYNPCNVDNAFIELEALIKQW